MVPGFQLVIKQPKSFKASNEIIFSIEFEVPWILCWNFKYHKIHHDDPYVSIVREFKFKEKFNFDQRCKLDQVKQYLKHLTKQVMDNSSTSVKKDDKCPSSSSSKGSKKKATFKKFMKWLEHQSDDDSISSTESYFDPMGGPCAQDPYDI